LTYVKEGNIGHKDKFNRENTLNEYKNECNDTNKNSNTGCSPADIIILRIKSRAEASGVIKHQRKFRSQIIKKNGPKHDVSTGKTQEANIFEKGKEEPGVEVSV
jgi:hypothetical protein